MAKYMSNAGLRLANREDILSLTAVRKGETKLGEVVQVVESLEQLKEKKGRFVLLGIKEDIGIIANLGKPGSTSCWDWALKSILNVQSNAFIHGKELVILGALEFEPLLSQAQNLDPANDEDLKLLRKLTAEIDTHVSDVIRKIVGAGKVPVVIGGGHNNSFGNISGTSKALGHSLNVLNIDPHTDFRALEGRHSGNGFSYAREGGFLGKYAVYGLHEGYNSKAILENFEKDPTLTYTSFEELLNKSDQERYQGFLDILNWLESGPMGLELDLDSITRFPVSALNPSGFTLNEIRTLIRATAGLKDVQYFHICEGSPERAANDLEREMLGKSIAYLVTDFIKGCSFK